MENKKQILMCFAEDEFINRIRDSLRSGIDESGQVECTYLNAEAFSEADNQKVRNADYVIWGSPDYKGDVHPKLWKAAIALRERECKDKQMLFVGRGPLDGDFAGSFKRRLQDLGGKPEANDFLFYGTPDSKDLKKAYELGFDISCTVRKIPNPRRAKLVRCPICGEIFDASLGVCPVCGLGVELCEPVEADEAANKKDTDNRYVIIGGGAAAVSAAEAMRQRDGTGNIALYSAEEYLPITRPMLTKDLAAIKEDLQCLQLHPQEWYEERKIQLNLGCIAEEIDEINKQIRIRRPDKGDEMIPYDKLVIASGAECFVPPFKGREKEGLLTIRHTGDVLMLLEKIKTAKNAVIIGGGVLGLEAASEILRQGVRVTVLEATPQIIGRQIDAGSAEILKEKMKKMGVACYEGVSIEEIEGKEQVTGVRISDGRCFPADIVVVSCGNRANTSFLKGTSVKINRAIVVGNHMQTSVKDIYACGDCAEFQGINYQLWQEASEQGRTAGANAAGDPLVYRSTMLGLSLEGFGTSLYALGDPGKKEGIPYKRVEVKDDVAPAHETYWFLGHSLKGAVVIGREDKTADISRYVLTQARYEEIF